MLYIQALMLAIFTTVNFGYDIVLDRLERVIHQLVELQTAE